MSHASFLKKAIACAAALAVAASLSVGAMAAPAASPLAVKNAVQSDVIDVRHVGRRNAAIALGVLGALWLGAVVAPHYHPHPHFYGPHPYGPKCWYQTGPRRGQGFWDYC